MKRPKDHRRESCPDSYCRNWVKTLQQEGLDYKITVLEVLKSEVELADAERWWIAYGRACGWPLTNLTSGGGWSEEAILQKQRRQIEGVSARTAREAASTAREAAELQAFYAPDEPEAFDHLRRYYGIPAEIERQCFAFFTEHAIRISDDSLINAAIAAVRVTRGSAERLYAKWQTTRPILKIEQDCFQFFVKRALQISSDQLIAEAITVVGVHREFAPQLYAWWLETGPTPEIERKCFQFFDKRAMRAASDDLVEDVIAAVGVQREFAPQLHAKWLTCTPAPELRHGTPAELADVKQRCFRFFERGGGPFAINKLVGTEKVTVGTATMLYDEWISSSYERAKAAHKPEVHVFRTNRTAAIDDHVFRVLRDPLRFGCTCGHEEPFNEHDHASIGTAAERLNAHIRWANERCVLKDPPRFECICGREEAFDPLDHSSIATAFDRLRVHVSWNSQCSASSCRR
jgi:hypothetical protein